MILENPELALYAVLPHIYPAHFKDRIMINAERTGQLIVAGVPAGEGFLLLEKLAKCPLDQGLWRITLENVWGHSGLSVLAVSHCQMYFCEKEPLHTISPLFNPKTIVLN